MNKDIHILIVEDDANMRKTLADILSEENYLISGVESIKSAREELKNKFYNLALVDLKLADGSGLELLREIKELSEETMSIVLTGFASLESALSAMNQGAFSYLQKPLNLDELKISIKKALKMQELSSSNKDLIAKLQDLTLKEPLTGLYNYRYLRERISSEFKRAKRYVYPLSIIMLDIDYLKSINDTYGHQYGDSIIKEFAQELLKGVRGNDVVIRYGGDEFIILLPDTNREGAVIFAKRLFSALTEHIFDQKNNRIKLKVSIGVSSFPQCRINTEQGFLDSADQALRGAKEKGGNGVFVFKSANEKELEALVQAGGEENINKLKKKLLQMESRVSQTLLESIYAFAKTIEAKDYYTGEHAENMAAIAVAVARKLNLSEKEIENLSHAATLHDLGKIGVPDSILHKKGKLTREERKVIEKHPQIGAEIIRSIHFLSEVVPMVLYHHERYDGLGYSAGLKGEEIPLGARIIAVADIYQALISDRPYRKAYSKKEALKIIQESAGTHLDPVVVRAFMKTMQPKV